MSSTNTDLPTSPDKEGAIPVPNPYGWWYADCPRHGRTPHLSLFGGLCQRCVAEQHSRAFPIRRTRQ
jgi:hypothetical protein